MHMEALEKSLQTMDEVQKRIESGKHTPKQLALESVLAVLVSCADAVTQCVTLGLSYDEMAGFAYLLEASAYDLQLMVAGEQPAPEGS